MSDKIKKGDWIFWRWIKDGKALSKSFVQGIEPANDDVILELTDYDWGSKYPLRVLSKEVEVYKTTK